MNKSKNAKTPKKKILVIGLTTLLLVIGAILYIVVLGNKSQNSATIQKTNQDNAQTIEEEKGSDAIVITDENQLPTSETEDIPQHQVESYGYQPTTDQYGPSTKLDRPNVQDAVIALEALYADFITKLKAIPVDERQAFADQYYSERSSYFSPSYNYAFANNLHLLPQAASIAIPDSTRAFSAIIDPENSSQTIVQIFMDPDTSWSILVVVKMNADGTIGTIEKLIPRQNQNPL